MKKAGEEKRKEGREGGRVGGIDGGWRERRKKT